MMWRVVGVVFEVATLLTMLWVGWSLHRLAGTGERLADPPPEAPSQALPAPPVRERPLPGGLPISPEDE
jgi:hypothetical protein